MDRLGLQDAPHVHDVADVPVGEIGDCLDRNRVLEDLPQREGAHHRPRALADLQYAQLLQKPQPLAHQGPADAQLLRELSLGRQTIAGAVLAGICRRKAMSE